MELTVGILLCLFCLCHSSRPDHGDKWLTPAINCVLQHMRRREFCPESRKLLRGGLKNRDTP